MKKALPILILLLLAGVAWYFSAQRKTAGTEVASNTTQAKNNESAGSDAATSSGASSAAQKNPNGEDDEEGTVDADVQPASRAYKNAEEALAAVKKGAADYDDTILEQFTQPGEDCTWCPEFYKGIREMLGAPGISPDQLSYYSELLAISGRLDNVQALVDGIKNPASEEQAEAYAEALELTVGKDNVVQYLSDQLGNTDERLREASVAAITNQGSRLAAEILYKNTVDRGDPDGYYSLGIGLGEFVPDEDSLPYLEGLVDKRDQYSHLAVKALLNSGLDGLKMVFDSLSSSNNPDFDRQMLTDAVDHVNYEEDIEAYLKQQVSSQANPALKDFAQKALDSMKESQATDTDNQGDQADGGGADEPMQSTVNQ